MIAIGSDHGGYALKQAVMKHLESRGVQYRDFGTYSEASCDYPDYGRAVAEAVASGEYQFGIFFVNRYRHFHYGQQSARDSGGSLWGLLFR